MKEKVMEEYRCNGIGITHEGITDIAALSVALGVYEVGKGIAEVFKLSKANAKLAGALLGCTLALREPFHT